MANEGLQATQRRNWSDLPVELLDIIFSSKLSSLVDVLNVKQVCSSWRRAIAGVKDPKKFRQLVFFPTSKNIDKCIRFVSLEDERPYPIFRKIFSDGLDNITKSRLFGSYHGGWVILLDKWEDICITNLITEMSIPVPQLNRNSSLYFHVRAILSHDPSRHADFVVAILDSGWNFESEQEHEISFWRHGDIAWSPLRRDLVDASNSFIDIAFHKYSLYALCLGDPYIIETWDFEQALPEKKMVVELSCVSPTPVRDPFLIKYTNRLVLSPSGEIFIASNPNELFYRNQTWKPMKVDLGKKICEVLNSLNGGALLYGRNGCLLVSPVDVQRHGYNPNSVYFVDQIFDEPTKLMMYSFEDDKTCEIWDLGEATDNDHCWTDLTTTIYSC